MYMEPYIVIKNMNNYIDYEILKPKEGSKIIAYFCGYGYEVSMVITITYFKGDLLNDGFLYKYKYKNE